MAYFGSYRAIWLVACASMALGLSELGRIGCLVTNRTGLIARNQCLAAGAGLILNFILVPALGFMGAALSAAISFSLLAGLQAITSARFLTWRWPFGSLWRVLIASGAMAASVLLIQTGLHSNTIAWQIVSLLLSIMTGALIYGLALWALGEVSPRQLLIAFRANPARVSTPQVTGETEVR
jgi:O-antigen/teichoic acid export membrane protein